MHDIKGNLADIRTRIAAACARSGRDPASAGLIAVSKTFPADALAALATLDQQNFGESYLQEALEKIPRVEALALRPLRWHFIGPIQSNKTAAVAATFDWAHAVDRLKIAQRLSDQRLTTQAPLNICVQVNISGEASKAGCAPEAAAALCAEISALPRLRLRGLMCIPAAVSDAEDARLAFRAVRTLHTAIRNSGAVSADFDTLSMGMSDDFEVAIEEGATWVRIGSALFGPRQYAPAFS